MTTIAAALDSGAPGQLEEAARALVALRYYQRFIDHASAHDGAREGGGGAG
jgi:hypothetical protein